MLVFNYISSKKIYRLGRNEVKCQLDAQLVQSHKAVIFLVINGDDFKISPT